MIAGTGGRSGWCAGSPVSRFSGSLPLGPLHTGQSLEEHGDAGPHHGQRGRGASEYPGGVSQLIHQVRLPFSEELLGTASPADVESCLTLLQSSRTLIHRPVRSGSPGQMWLLYSARHWGRVVLSLLEDKVCLHALHISCPWGLRCTSAKRKAICAGGASSPSQGFNGLRNSAEGIGFPE